MNELYVDSVTKSYGRSQVLTDVFISCKPGDIVGLLGRNGSGKSTLLKIIFGSTRADNKFIRVDGNVSNGLWENKSKISYLPQHSFLPTHLKIRTIVDLFCDRRDVNDVKNNDHIKPFLNNKAKELSDGERRLIEILLIVNTQAKYVLIDEPFNGVAPLYKVEIKQLVQKHAQKKGFIIT
ncbi:MAG: ABC transporter ATP-binding protein, partial [Marivirga sp.]|nr:ABC transporter ATP-binding protein [Marivirga sp.]